MHTEGKLAIVEDDPFLREQLTIALKNQFEVLSAGDSVSGLALLDSQPDLMLLDLRLPPSHEAREGLDLIRAIRQKRPEMTIVVMTGEREHEYALKAIELGAFDFFRKPVDTAELRLLLSRAFERKKLLDENRELRRQVIERNAFDQLIGSSQPMQKVFEAIRKIAPSDATVLITGESGTGKELAAHAIHRASHRKDGPFVAVNGAALQDTLAESDLFGHEKGAYTGASTLRVGKFELAHGGTLFLDEIATLSPAVQAKLLRAIESREIERLGGRRTIHVDIRLISATNEELEKRIAAGTFREDLYYRINAVTLALPPLRDRSADIPMLVESFAARYGRRNGKPQKRFSPAVLEMFQKHSWRGNVRELEHLVEMLTLMVSEPEIFPEHLPPMFQAGDRGMQALPELPFAEAVQKFEQQLLVRAIEQSGGVKTRAAQLLGLDANQMKYLCRKHKL